MPSWKKVVASGSDASFSSATVDTFVSASSFRGSFTGSLFGTASQALTASYLLGYASSFPFTGSAQITGSLGVTGSFSVTAPGGSSAFSSNADTLLITGSLIITGSGASITGSLNVSNGITGSLFGTASQAVSASYAFTASSAISASFAVNYLGSGSISTRLTNLETASGSFSTRVTNTEVTSSNLVAASASFSTRITNDSSSFSSRVTRTEATASNLVAASSSFSTRTTSLEGASGSFSTRVTQIERTYATTGSNIFTGSQNILGAITASAALINGTLTAQTLVVTTVSSSVVFSSGSNVFGNSTANTQTFTGSVNISGSLTLNGRATLNNLTGSLFGTASWATNFITGSVTSASYAYTASSATNAFQAVSASFAFTASSAVRASASLIATSASYAFTASSAILASASLVATSASYAYTASSAISASYALTASFLLGYVSPFPFTGSAQITGSLGVTGSLSVSAGITGSLFGTASQATSASYAFTASYVNPLRQNVIISGSLTVSASATALSIQGSGSNVFSVDGTSGRLFEIDDSLSGSLFSVNTAAGLPVIEAFSDNTVRIGQFGQRALFVSQSRVGVGTETPTTNLDVSGSGRFTNGLSLTGSINSLNGYTGSLFGTASWARNAITASYALGGDASAILYQTASAAFTWSFNHFLQTQYPVFTIYDNTNSVIVPQRIQAVNTSSALIYFSSPTTGIAVASKGGYSSSVVTSAVIANTAITASFALSGTGTFSGSFSGSYQGNFSGSLVGTASQAVSASYALNAANAFVQNGNSFAAPAILGTINSQNLALITNNAVRLFISSSGNYIGIGANTPFATVPQALLDVNGIINARGGIQIIGNSPTIAISASRTDNTFPGTLLFNGWGDYAFNNSLLVGYDSTTLGPVGLNQGNLFVRNRIAIGKTGSSAAFDVNGSAIITGSLIVLSGITGSLSGSITGSLFGTSSQAFSSSYAATSSFANNFTVANTLTAQTLVVQTVTSSIVYSSGSNIFGNDLSNTQTFTGSVNVTGSLTIRGKINSVDSIKFNTSAGVTVGEGELAWNSSDGTLDLGMKGGNVTQQIGEEIFYEIRNETTSSILNGTSLYANGVTAGSGRITAAPFVADGNTREVRYLGLATENISTGVNGFVTHFGYVRGLDTRGTDPSSIAVGDENWSVGDILYAHPTVAGKLTNVKPKHEIIVAIVIIRNQTSGVLFVRPSSFGHLEDLHDVNINTGSLSTGDLLIYDSGSDYWVNSKQLSGSYGLTGSLQATSFTGSLYGTASWASNAVSASYALTASYALNAGGSFPYTGSAQITGSLGVTGSFSVSAGAGSSVFSSNADTLLITGSLIITGSGASITGSLKVSNGITGSLFGTASQAQTASFVLNAVSSSYAFTASSAISASYAFTASSATNATNALSASNFTITGTLNFDGTLTDYNAIASTSVGTNNVFVQSTGSYRSGFFKYTAINGTNARTGEVMVAWNGANIVFTDFATTDIGATNDVTMSAALAAGAVQFNAITQGSGWNIRSIGTYM